MTVIVYSCSAARRVKNRWRRYCDKRVNSIWLELTTALGYYVLVAFIILMWLFCSPLYSSHFFSFPTPLCSNRSTCHFSRTGSDHPRRRTCQWLSERRYNSSSSVLGPQHADIGQREISLYLPPRRPKAS